MPQVFSVVDVGPCRLGEREIETSHIVVIGSYLDKEAARDALLNPMTRDVSWIGVPYRKLIVSELVTE